jgi:hypothetical protein
MKNQILNLCDKLFTGSYSIKLKKDLYLNFPRLAPIFTIAFVLTAFGSIKKIDIIENIGIAMVIISIFGFFYPNIFKRYNR